MRHGTVILLLVLGVVIGVPLVGWPQTYTFTTLALPDAAQNWPQAINERPIKSFLYHDGTLSPIKGPHAQSTQVSDVNSLGQIVGWYGSGQGFLRGPKGQYTKLHGPFPDASSTHPNAINKHGQIVGIYFENSGYVFSFLYEEGDFTLLHLPHSATTIVHGLNDYGQIVGRSCCHAPGSYRAFLYDQGVFVPIEVPFAYPYPQSMRTEAYGINNAGHIIGSYQDPVVLDSQAAP
jgi:hypothetical protein